ncbi:hypothetical protein A2765_00610 [Candidatus Kaiserbacteria bacterium RIFCSPHIGHO2_01_FULL_56_24]|uniref:Uncharacterized protein n=1 Tax=Candidatus Kaiserbacteria bacterium RIFCSPHIGHO2_01_FULL_56_24 TaxID=1798487 RepID=A0A1F6DC25_9BACT|nr:MAG: hypothetical protein A2765_00610 [Candidatus Kaiserbacteria bacterium RIFCSPHIGHO2_01_FULL_56_24]
MCAAQYLALFPLIVVDALPELLAVANITSMAAIEGPNGVFERSYFFVIPYGVVDVLKYEPAFALRPTSIANKATTASFAAFVVIDDVVASDPNPVFSDNVSMGDVVDTSTPEYGMIAPSAVVCPTNRQR